MPSARNAICDADRLAGQVRGRFGVLPNFFRQVPAPGRCWPGCGRSLRRRTWTARCRRCSRNGCSCICPASARCGTASSGMPASWPGSAARPGDSDAPPQTVEQITGLLRRAGPRPRWRRRCAWLEVLPGPAAMPGPGTQLEADLLDVLAVIFLDAEQAARARAAVTAAAGIRPLNCCWACWPSSAPRTTGPRPIRTCRWNRTPPRSWTSTRSSPGCWPIQRTRWRPARGRPGTPPPPTSRRPGDTGCQRTALPGAVRGDGRRVQPDPGHPWQRAQPVPGGGKQPRPGPADRPAGRRRPPDQGPDPRRR